MMIRSVFLGMSLIIVTSNLFGQDRIRYITPKKVAENMSYVSSKGLDKWYLINVLPRYLWAEGSIPDSINIPVNLIGQKFKNEKKWPRNRKIISYCSGGKSRLCQHAYRILKELGFNDLQILEGGIDAWQQNGYPIKGQWRLRDLDESL